MPSLTQDTPPAVPASAPEQIPACAASDALDSFLMPHYQAAKAAFYAKVRKSVIAAAGECEQ